jgi:hypothetical protein
MEARFLDRPASRFSLYQPSYRSSHKRNENERKKAGQGKKKANKEESSKE